MSIEPIPFDDASLDQRAAKYADGSYVFGAPLMCADSKHVVVRRDDLRFALENDYDTNRIYPMGRKEGKTYRMARERLENALAGKMR